MVPGYFICLCCGSYVSYGGRAWMNGENRRSREAVRNSIRTYGVKVMMDPASLPLKKTKDRESQESVSRFSEKSLHSQYQMQPGEGFCKSLLHRIPYATLLACILCVLGVVIFCTARLRGTVVTSAMINDILKDDSSRLATFDIIFLVLEISTAIIAAMILIIGILATGDTRARVYSAWKARAGGRLCCALLMVLTIVLFFVWLAVFWLCATLFFVMIISKVECDLFSELSETKNCLHLPMLNVFIHNKKEDIQICANAQVKKFCKDYVEKVYAAYITAAFGDILIIFSLVFFVICLAANYARIRCQAKFQELEELRHLEGDLHNSKDRF